MYLQYTCTCMYYMYILAGGKRLDSHVNLEFTAVLHSRFTILSPLSLGRGFSRGFYVHVRTFCARKPQDAIGKQLCKLAVHG